jgi:error-prone DNA polymerase
VPAAWPCWLPGRTRRRGGLGTRTGASALAGRRISRGAPGSPWNCICGRDDRARLAELQALGEACGLPLVAAGDVHMHVRSRRPLQDALTAMRLGVPVAEAGFALFANAERTCARACAGRSLYPAALLAETLEVAAQLRLLAGRAALRVPGGIVPAGHTPVSWLRGSPKRARRPLPGGLPDKVRGSRSSTNWR